MGIKFKEILAVDDVRDLSVTSYFGIMLMDAGEHSTLVDCVLSLSRKYTLKCIPEEKSVRIYNDQYSVKFMPDGDTMTIIYRCLDEYDDFITDGALVVSTLMTSWDADVLGDLTYE